MTTYEWRAYQGNAYGSGQRTSVKAMLKERAIVVAKHHLRECNWDQWVYERDGATVTVRKFTEFRMP